MESYRLVHEGDPRGTEWVLEWDETTLALKGPDGELMFEAPPGLAHRVVELYELYIEGKITFGTPFGSWAFQKHTTALAALRKLVEAGLASDAAFRSALQRHSLRCAILGLAMTIVGGGLFGLYCWYASWAPDPPPGHWIRWFGWLIHGVLLVLMAAGLGGPILTYSSLRMWLRMRHIGRLAAEATPAGDRRVIS